MKLSDMKTHRKVLEEDLARDLEFRREWERTALARDVSNFLVAYRAQHRLTQEELGRKVSMKQPAIARLESGEHTPNLATLERIARKLGVELHLDFRAPTATSAKARS